MAQRLKLCQISNFSLLHVRVVLGTIVGPFLINSLLQVAAAKMSRRIEIEELQKSTPGPACRPVHTVLDTKNNAMSSKIRIRAEKPLALGVTAWTEGRRRLGISQPCHQRLGLSPRRKFLNKDPPGERLTSYNSYFPNEIFEGAITGYLFNVYCRKLTGPKNVGATLMSRSSSWTSESPWIIIVDEPSISSESSWIMIVDEPSIYQMSP